MTQLLGCLEPFESSNEEWGVYMERVTKFHLWELELSFFILLKMELKGQLLMLPEPLIWQKKILTDREKSVRYYLCAEEVSPVPCMGRILR